MRRALMVVGLMLWCGCSHGPAPTVNVTSAVELAPVGQSSLIVGRDGGWSSRAFDHEVFLFGDTFVSQADTLGSTFHSNSFSFTDDLVASDGITGLADRVDAAGSPLPLITPTDDEATFIAAHVSGTDGNCPTTPCGARWATWPGGAVWDATRARALIPYGLIYAEPGAFNFHGVGGAIAEWNDWTEQATRPALTYCPDHPTMLFCEHETDWTPGLVLDGETLYGFACKSDGFTSKCHVARVPAATPSDRSQWQVWDGSNWVPLTSSTNGATLFEGGINMRVHYNHFANAWMAIYAKNLSNSIAYRTAPTVTGPWSGERKLFEARQTGDGTTYDAYVQPDYSEADGRVLYVTYSRGTGTWFGSELALWKITLESAMPQ